MRQTTKLGETGPEVFPIALGCMGMSDFYGAGDEAEGLATIQAAIDRGVTLIDTGDFYGMGANEMLIGRAIAGRREKVRLSVKFGAQRGPDGAWLGFDARPAAVKTACAYSLKRLGTDHIDVYRPGRLDPATPIEETVGALAELVRAGYVRHIGLSEVGPETLRRAAKVHPIVDVQIEYSIASRSPEARLFPALREVGASATLYSVLGRGLLTGSRPTGAADFRAYLPRFAPDNRARNDGVVEALGRFAAERGMKPAALLVAWVRAKQPAFVPVIGARTRAHLDGALGALDRSLTEADVAALERLVPPSSIVGTRYPEAQMQHLDSER